MTIQQISVFLENKAGELAQITDALSARQIDLRAIHIAETADYGVLRLIVDQPGLAAQVLTDGGFVLSVTPVLAVAVPDRAGGLAEVLRILSQERVDIQYLYSVFGSRNGHAYMIFRVADPEGLAALLAHSGISVADGSELGIR